MSSVRPTNCLERVFPVSHFKPQQAKKWALVALAAIMALGMIFSYALGAPWLVILLFFALTLVPLYPVKTIFDEQRQRVLENQAT